MDPFKEAIADIAEKAGLPRAQALGMVNVPKERDRADFTLPCFAFAKALGKAPNDIAADVAGAFDAGDWLASAEAAGPFVNFRVNRAAFAKRTLDAVDIDYGRSDEGAGKTVVIDYGSPNIAKPLHFHHLRSSVIGQALCNLHRWCGYEVVGLNYLGDVGTAFGKLMVGIEEWGEPKTVEAFNKTYKDASSLCNESEAAMERARVWAKRLEDDDPEAVRLLKEARTLSLAGFAAVYEWLGIHHDVIDGEKMYVKAGHALVDELLESGVAEESEGGVVIDLGKKLKVFLIRKSDGGSLYQTRDLAAARDRMKRYNFSKMLYAVDVAQEFYFRQLFGALKKMGHDWADQCVHVKFGQVLIGGRRAKAREGKAVHLEDVLREGERRARAVVEEKNADLPNKDEVAKAVGTAAVIYCDLGFPTTKNIDFDWDAILSFDGRTGPYLQYVHASACSILRKGGNADEPDLALLDHDTEWTLVRRLAEFPAAVGKACADCEPSVVSTFLYDLAREFRSYHAAGGRDASLRVLTDDAGKRAARLALVRGVQTTLGVGLRLLGIDALEVM